MAAHIRVLLADDSELFRRAVATLLFKESTITLVGEACSYQELLTKLGESDVDVILMDVHMPNAHQANPEYIKAQLSKPCLLAMSFANDKETIDLAGSFGAVRLLDKTELARTLVSAIKECVQQKGKAHSAYAKDVGSEA
jgi:DNA-binding NarL/FixJ family response regulator